MKEQLKLGKEIEITECVNEDDVIGKFAFNKTHGYGGIIIDINNHSVTLEGGFFPTQTGNCVYDSLTINGFRVYEIEKN